MHYELDEIKKIRKSLGITQAELAKRANVSQSMIAKIESKRMDPTFSKTKKIFEAISYFEKGSEIKASQIMNTQIISIKSNENIKDAIRKMKKFNISQMPVIDNNKTIGLISESTLLKALIEEKGKYVYDVMGETPPTLSRHTSIKVISNLLMHYPMVLIADEGKLIGIITKSDLIGKLYKM